MNVADILDRAADLIEPEGAWIQGFFSNRCGGHCMAGAILEVADLTDISTLRVAVEAVLPAPPEERAERITWWNDEPGRTQAEVVAKLREAAAKARLQAIYNGER